jgi:TolA-binding protein
MFLACACVLLPAVGCWMTTAQGERLQEAGEARDSEITRLRGELYAEREQFDAKVQKLEEVLEKATRLLTRNSADRGAQVDQLQERLALLEGQLAELRHELETASHEIAHRHADLELRINQLAHKAGIDMPVAISDIPADKAAHFSAAGDAFDKGEHPKARALYREYLTRYPEDDKAGAAQYWIGASYLGEGKPATALGEFRKVISKHGESDALDLALLGMGEAFYRLHACTDAKNALEALLRRKPKGQLEKDARKKLEEVEKAPDNYCTS